MANPNQSINNYFDQLSPVLNRVLDRNPQTSQGVAYFIDWIRNVVKNFFINKIESIPYIGALANKHGLNISEGFFNVMDFFMNSFKIVATSENVLAFVHQRAMTAWHNNRYNGLITQSFAFAISLSKSFLKIMGKCWYKAVMRFVVEEEEDDNGFNNAIDKANEGKNSLALAGLRHIS